MRQRTVSKLPKSTIRNSSTITTRKNNQDSAERWPVCGASFTTMGPTSCSKRQRTDSIVCRLLSRRAGKLPQCKQADDNPADVGGRRTAKGIEQTTQQGGVNVARQTKLRAPTTEPVMFRIGARCEGDRCRPNCPDGH